MLYPTVFGDRWLNEIGFKESLAAKIGISTGLLKRTLLAGLNGSPLQATEYSTVFKSYLIEFDNYEVAKAKLEQVKAEITEFRDAVAK